MLPEKTQIASTATQSPTLGYVIIYVPNVVAAVTFYENAFGVRRRFIHDSQTYAEMETGGTALAFADETETVHHGWIHPNRIEAKAAGAEVAFVVNDVAGAFHRAVSNGATPVMQPSEKPWGQTISYVRDLNGFLVEICSVVVPSQ